MMLIAPTSCCHGSEKAFSRMTQRLSSTRRPTSGASVEKGSEHVMFYFWIANQLTASNSQARSLRKLHREAVSSCQLHVVLRYRAVARPVYLLETAPSSGGD